MFLSFCFLLVVCLFVTEKNVVVGRKKEGVGLKRRRFFAVWVVLSRCKKMGSEVEKRIK